VVRQYLHELHGHELESLLLEPLDDFADDSPVDAVRLDHDEGAFVGHVEDLEDVGSGGHVDVGDGGEAGDEIRQGCQPVPPTFTSVFAAHAAKMRASRRASY